MMIEYIEREAAKEAIGFIRLHHIEYAENKSLLDAINEIPAADVSPVVHGRWEHNSDFPDRFICYGCGAMFDMWKHEQRLFNYCPNCGAKMDMDGGEDDG